MRALVPVMILGRPEVSRSPDLISSPHLPTLTFIVSSVGSSVH